MLNLISEKYIRIRIRAASEFVEDSFHSLVVDDTIKVIMGRLLGSGKLSTQSYLFEKDKWNVEDAKSWADAHMNTNTSVVEKLASNHTIVTANLTLCSALPNLKRGKADIKPLASEAAFTQSKLNDKYYFYAQPVFEGTNLNGDTFSRDEIINSYMSMAHTPLDWEHRREEIVGHALDSELVTDGDNPISIGINGVINRLSPWLQIEEAGVVRDDIIRQRYFEGKLALSMECLFSGIKCSGCGSEFFDFLEFEHHKYTRHAGDSTISRGLMGVDFIGNGIVANPAELKADVLSLRTSDDGTIAIEIASAAREKYGSLAENITFASFMANTKPDVDLIEGKLVVANTVSGKNVKNSDNFAENKTKNATINDKENEQESTNNELGGNAMYKLAEKVAGAKTLSDIFVQAQVVLKDYMGDEKLSAEDAEAFASELTEVVKAYVSNEGFRVEGIATLTNEQKLDAVSVARDEEKKIAEAVISDLNSQVTAERNKVQSVQTELNSVKATIQEMTDAQAKQAIENKALAFVDNVEKAGISLTDSMKLTVKKMAVAAIESSEDEASEKAALDGIHNDFVATVKQSTLTKASQQLGDSSFNDGNEGDLDLAGKLAKARAEHKEE